MELIELPHFPIGSPALIALPRVSQVEMCDLLESTGRVEACCEFIAECLIVDEAVHPRRKDRKLVQSLGFELMTFDTCKFSPYERGSVLEILRALRRPDFKLYVMSPQ